MSYFSSHIQPFHHFPIDESLKSQSKRTIIWAILVRMVSGYQPSLYSCQRSLPRQPIPKLKCTLEKLIDSLQPLCDKVEIDELRREAESFEKGLGSNLQNILILKSWWAPNYMTDWWYVKHFSNIAFHINFLSCNRTVCHAISLKA